MVASRKILASQDIEEVLFDAEGDERPIIENEAESQLNIVYEDVKGKYQVFFLQLRSEF